MAQLSCSSVGVAIAAAMSEKAPLLHYRLTACSISPEPASVFKRSGFKLAGKRRSKDETAPKLGVVFGVVIPTLLSMFSVVVFLRIGEYYTKMKTDLETCR